MSRFPLVFITYQTSMVYEDLARYSESYAAVCAQAAAQTPCVMVVDISPTPAERATLRARRDLVGLINAAQAKYPGSVLAEAVILEGALANTLYTAYVWLQNDKKVARRAFYDKDKALAWAQNYLTPLAKKTGGM